MEDDRSFRHRTVQVGTYREFVFFDERQARMVRGRSVAVRAWGLLKGMLPRRTVLNGSLMLIMSSL